MHNPNDDLAGAPRPFRVIACMPVHGRLPLLRQTIQRLYRKNDVERVICSGDGAEEQELCESLGAVWVQHENRPLGAKWNAAFRKAADYNPDAVLYVGSSDFVSDNWTRVMQPYVENFGFAGVPGCHFIDLGKTIRLCYWSGYAGTKYHKERFDETIGIGRMLSRAVMDKIGWEPFDNNYDNSLDRSMKERVLKYAGLADQMVRDPKLAAVSISTDKWVNKHRFEQHYGNVLPSKIIEDTDGFIQTNFPELLEVFPCV